MSYDIWLEVDTGAGKNAVIDTPGNYTSNCAGMWADALGHSLKDFDGKRCGDCLPALEAAVEKMAADPDRYEAMNPANGWGDYPGARDYLAKLRDACRDHPNAVIRMWV